MKYRVPNIIGLEEGQNAAIHYGTNIQVVGCGGTGGYVADDGCRAALLAAMVDVKKVRQVEMRAQLRRSSGLPLRQQSWTFDTWVGKSKPFQQCQDYAVRLLALPQLAFRQLHHAVGRAQQPGVQVPLVARVGDGVLRLRQRQRAVHSASGLALERPLRCGPSRQATGGSLDEQPGTIRAIAIYEALQRYWEIVFQTVGA